MRKWEIKWTARISNSWKVSYVLNDTWEVVSYWNKIDIWLKELNSYLSDYHWDNPAWFIQEKIITSDDQLSILDLFEDEQEVIDDVDKKITESIKLITENVTRNPWYKKVTFEIWWRKFKTAAKYEVYRKNDWWSNYWWIYTVHFLDVYNNDESLNTLKWKNKEEINKLIREYFNEFDFNK